jgi:hypothetical protein
MDKELKLAIEEVIESVESAKKWASREARLDMMEVFCAVYQLKRVFTKETKKIKPNK